MKKTLILMSIAVAGLMATDFSQLSTQELINLRGQVAPEEIDAFRTEMQSRVATMTDEERAALQASRQMNAQAQQNINRQTPPTFESIDADGDGKITQEELDSARASKIQANSDAGRLLQNVDNAPSLATIDKNGDGVVDTTEFQEYQSAQMATRSSQMSTQGMGMRAGGGQGQRMGGGGHGRP